jgi:hypothetical protein
MIVECGVLSLGVIVCVLDEAQCIIYKTFIIDDDDEPSSIKQALHTHDDDDILIDKQHQRRT